MQLTDHARRQHPKWLSRDYATRDGGIGVSLEASSQHLKRLPRRYFGMSGRENGGSSVLVMMLRRKRDKHLFVCLEVVVTRTGLLLNIW